MGSVGQLITMKCHVANPSPKTLTICTAEFYGLVNVLLKLEHYLKLDSNVFNGKMFLDQRLISVVVACFGILKSLHYAAIKQSLGQNRI